MEAVSKELQDAIITLPNLPHISVPQGKSAEDNVVVKQVAAYPTPTV